MADNQTPDLGARWKILDVLAAILSSLDLNLRLYSFFLSFSEGSLCRITQRNYHLGQGFQAKLQVP